jgi:hypothetical protein
VVIAFAIIPVIGILAAVAIPSFIKYTRKAKAAEARMNLGRITQGAIAYFDAEHLDGAGKALPKCFPANAGGWIESDADMQTGCCPLKCQPGAAPDAHAAGWQALSFSDDMPRYYKYRFRGTCCDGDDCARAAFTVQAIGDLSCSGTTTVFERTGTVVGGEVRTTPAAVVKGRDTD